MKKLLSVLYVILAIEVFCIVACSAIAQFQQKPMLGIQVDRASLLSKGLVGLWLFNEGSGNKVLDLSGNGLHLTSANFPTWVPGKHGSALDFVESSTNYAEIDRAATITLPVTIIAWFKADGITNADTLVWLGEKGNPQDFIVLLAGGNVGGDPIRFRRLNNGTEKQALSTKGFTANTWHMAAGVVVSKDELRAYLDGGNEGITVDSAAFTSAYDRTAIGGSRDSTPGAYMEGVLGHVMIYNRVLPASEIAELYLRPFAMFEKDDIAMLATAAEPPPPPSGQVIMIQMSVISVIFALIFIRIKNGKSYKIWLGD